MVKFTFPRKLRLLIPDHFDFVFQQPKRVEILKITIFGRLNTLGYARVGLVIAKRQIKYAHERNRIKRLMRESFRLAQHKLPYMDFVVMVKRKVDKLNNRVLLKTLEKLWHCYVT